MKGLGRAFMDSQIYDGFFEEGSLKGMGVQYNIKENIHIFGEFDKNYCRKLISSKEGFPKHLLSMNWFL